MIQLIVAEELSIPPEKVRVLVIDPDLTPDGGPTTASRPTYIIGNAVRLSTQKLREIITKFLESTHSANPEKIAFSGGAVQVNNQNLSFSQIAKLMGDAG